MAACHRAFDTYQDEAQLGEMRRAAMARCFGWSGAAAEYEALYRRLIGPAGSDAISAKAAADPASGSHRRRTRLAA